MIDVRQLPDYIEGHLPGSIAVPGGLAIQRADEFVPVRAARVVFIDRQEARAALAAYWYRQMGFSSVHVLQGGLQGWLDNGGVPERGRGRQRPLGWDDALRSVRSIVPPALATTLADAASQVHIINVDTSAVAVQARLPQSEWIPYGDLEDRVAAMSAQQRAGLLLTCRNGDLSILAAANLARAGWPDVPALTGGVAAWRAAGHTIEQGASGALAGASDLVVQPYDAGLAEMQRYLEWELQLTEQLKERQTVVAPSDAASAAPASVIPGPIG
jgi:rhodanese-related sulfurtransferase